MVTALLISMVLSFLATFFITKYAIDYFREAELVDIDVHKKKKIFLPHSIGLPVAAGLLFGILFYIFVQVFLYSSTSSLLTLFASVTTILIITIIGFVDDINTRQVEIRNHHEGKRGLKRWVKPLLTLPAAFPLMVIMAGITSMSIPLIGEVQFGILYTLLLVPIGVVAASNMVNMLGGFNGSEIGMGIVYTFSLGLFAWLHGSVDASVLFFVTFAALIAAMKFNFYPAKILPGDSLTYLLGAIVATGAIIGNMEKVAIITMLLFIINVILKFYNRYRFGFFPSNLGLLQRDGTLRPRYNERVYGLTQWIMSVGNFTEKQMTLILIGLQIIFSIIGFSGIL